MQNTLHWSFNCIKLNQSFFNELKSSLAKYYASSNNCNEICRYNILANNYWNWQFTTQRQNNTKGYPGTKVGELSITRKAIDNGTLSHRIYQDHSVAAEYKEYTLTSSNDKYQELTGDWQMKTSSYDIDYYKGFTCCGRISEKGILEIDLADGVTYTAGSVPDGSIILTQWSFLDTIDEIYKDKRQVTILWDTLTLKRNIEINHFDDMVLDIEGKPLMLHGYAVSGEGLETTYFWVDRNGKTAIMITIFDTYVITR